MKKVKLFICLMLSALLLNTSTMNAEVNENYDSLSDDEIIEILKLYHNGTCGVDEKNITEQDVQEFKNYYNFYKQEELFTRSMFPNSYSHYFKSSTGWITRDGKISLSIYYNPSAMYIGGNNPNAQAANAQNAFRLLKNKHSGHKNWKNTASMDAQFHCHVLTIGKLKNPWNIEPWRTESNLAKVIAKGCNP